MSPAEATLYRRIEDQHAEYRGTRRCTLRRDFSVRGVRRKAKEEIDKLVKDGEVGEDDGARGEKELDALTHKYTAQVDELVKHKEAELLEV